MHRGSKQNEVWDRESIKGKHGPWGQSMAVQQLRLGTLGTWNGWLVSKMVGASNTPPSAARQERVLIRNWNGHGL